jgi:RNA polymerase sigma-70 factor (ECF subfamily)
MSDQLKALAAASREAESRSRRRAAMFDYRPSDKAASMTTGLDMLLDGPPPTRKAAQRGAVNSHRDAAEKAIVGLFHRWRHGHRDLWNTLVLTSAGDIRARLSALLGGEVDDVLQDTLVKLLASAQRFRGESIGELYAYFLSAARHHAYAELRRRKRIQRTTTPLCEGVPEPWAEVELAEEIRAYWLKEAVDRLPTEKQRLIELYYVQNASAADIAKVYGILVPTIRSRIRLTLRALEKLVREMAGSDLIDARYRPRTALRNKSYRLR